MSTLAQFLRVLEDETSDCRLESDAYETLSDDQLSGDREHVGEICAKRTLGGGQSSFSRFFSGLWRSVFGES